MLFVTGDTSVYSTHTISCAQRRNETCSGHSKTCIACPAQPRAWIDNVGPNYVVHFLSSCCTELHSPLETAAFDIGDASLPVPFDNITFMGGFSPHPTVFQITSTFCPFLDIGPVNSKMVKTISISNLHLECPAQSQYGITVRETRALEMHITNTHVRNASCAVVVIGGGGYNTSEPFSGTDISNSEFSDVTIQSSAPNPAAIAFANTFGDDVSVGDMDTQLVVVQPLSTTSFKVSSPAPRIVDVSKYTNVFGAPYEIQYYHRGAYEEDYFSASLRTLLVYQSYAFCGLLLLLLLTNQDIVYYILVRSKARK